MSLNLIQLEIKVQNLDILFIYFKDDILARLKNL
jgi:hypothetical protein